MRFVGGNISKASTKGFHVSQGTFLEKKNLMILTVF